MPGRPVDRMPDERSCFHAEARPPVRRQHRVFVRWTTSAAAARTDSAACAAAGAHSRSELLVVRELRTVAFRYSPRQVGGRGHEISANLCHRVGAHTRCLQSHSNTVGWGRYGRARRRRYRRSDWRCGWCRHGCVYRRAPLTRVTRIAYQNDAGRARYLGFLLARALLRALTFSN